MSDELEIPVKYIVVAVVVLALVALYFFGSKFTGFAIGSVSENQARENLLDFFAMNIPESSFEILSSSKQGDFYMFDVTIDSEAVQLYVTGDGEYMTIDLVPLK
ncbi:MAG: hypothetical protein KKB79_02445 [Nanoarchaeota archaeon]|nr:hypothetical protein [Nanoarchaeota archaeon]